MVKRKSFFSAFLMILFMVGAMGLFVCFDSTEEVAFADAPYISEPEVTAEYFLRVNGKDAEYGWAAYDDDRGYARNVSVDVHINAPYYKIEYVTTEGDERTFDFVLETPADGNVSFRPTASGTYTVTISAYSDFSATDLLAQKTAWFRCDVDAPVLPEKMSDGLTKWVRSGNDNSFTVDWSGVSDARSGLYGVYYYYVHDGEEVSEIYSRDARLSPLDKNTFTVTEKCRFVSIFYDNAGNGSAYEIDLNQFDDTAPYLPTYTVTPTIENGKYAKSYEIQVTFSGDAGGSGLASVQFYRINGKTVQFSAEPPMPETIRLTVQADYEVDLYALDNAGNRTDYVSVSIPFRAFDVTPPDIGNVTVDYDLTDPDGICTVTATINDRGESGVQSVVIEGTEIAFTPGLVDATVYSAKFDCFGFENALRIIATDKAGNVNAYTVPFPHFKNAAINTALQRLTTSLRTLDEEEYTTKYAAQIHAAAERLATLLGRENTTEQDIVSAASSLNSLLLTEETAVIFEYVIESTPEYASANITLQMGEGLSGFKKGTVLTVTLAKTEGTKVFGREAGFETSFTDHFALRITENGEAREIGTGKIVVGMNMPIGYYERKIALFDADTGEKVETEIKNNKIYFGINRTSRYALVIEGGKASRDNGEGTATETITVFGNTLKKSTFYMILGITGGVSVLAIAAFVLISKLRR